MTGADLIKWIHENHAENLEVLVQHRDSGGLYRTAEHVGELFEIALCSFSDESYGVINTVDFKSSKATAMIL